jgi:hypothetical protein
MYFDRYSWDSAWAVGLALTAVIPWNLRAAGAAAIVTLIALAFFDVSSLSEYFSWNRTRWVAFDDLRARGVRIEQIEAGSEPFNFYEIAPVTQKRRRQLLAQPPRPYLLAFRPLAGYRAIASYPFSNCFGTHRGEIWVLQRISGTSA